MNIITILQSSEEIVDKSAAMAEHDPYGFIITLVSVSVVFASLILLYLVYRMIGWITNWYSILPKEETAAEEDHEDKMVHDIESYKITIRKGYSPSSGYAPLDAIASETGQACTSVSDKNVKAPLPGVIIAIKVNVGDTVNPGQTVAVLEAMKMENELQAEYAGTIQSINISKGDSVLEGTIIVTIR